MVTNSTYQNGPGDQTGALPKRKAGSKLTSGHLLMILSGLAAFLLIITLLGSQGKKITVYTARDNVFSGQKISINDFEAKEIPSSSLDSKYFSSKDFKDKVYASRLIAKGEPLLKQDQTPDSDTSSERLLSIPVPKKFAVNGTLVKGDKVDVFETPEDDGCAIRMLEGLTVVAVSSSSSGGLGGGDSTYAVIVSLENDVDDVKLSGVIGRGNNVQLGRTTGVDTSEQYNGPECQGLPE